MVQIGNEWDDILKDEFSADYFQKIQQTLEEEYAAYEIFPPRADIFNALKYTPYSNIKAVLLGQDPYHGPGQAHGLCFSVQPGVTPPPSLRNIFKELETDMGIQKPKHGCLTTWAEQGVLMLNTTLTVRRGQANSHSKIGWTRFTDTIIQKLNDHPTPIVFLLWGTPARAKKKLITNTNHLILECAHPSPLSAHNGFFGCRHFSQCNEFLMAHGIAPIDWTIRETVFP